MSSSPGGVLSSVVKGAVVLGVLLLSLTLVGPLIPGAIGNYLDRNFSLSRIFGGEDVDRTGPAVLVQLQDRSEFRAATGYYEVVVDKETGDGGFLGSTFDGQRVLYVGKGTADAFVDFNDLDLDRVRVSRDGDSVTIQLPDPTIDTPSLDVENSNFIETDGSLFNGDTTDLEKEAQVEAVEKLTAAASASGGLIELAKVNTVRFLEGFMEALGFTTVDVAFDSDLESDEEPSPAE